MWHDASTGTKSKKGNWDGPAAKHMYEHALAKSLKRNYGDLQQYRIVEDGDPTGYQSLQGREGKRDAKIRSWKLPPRSPEWNPLDYSIWDTIENKALKSVKGKQTKASWFEAIKKAALGLDPKYCVAQNELRSSELDTIN